jgi:formate hydrogenlyase subunit 3/multisubunit Na+/H+ antiporter MnhD subunit
MSEVWVLIGLALLATAGLPAWAAGRLWSPTRTLSAGLLVLGVAVVLLGLARPAGPVPFRLAWTLPIGAFSVRVDPLARFFLAPGLLVSALVAWHSLFSQTDRHARFQDRRWLFHGLFTAATGLVFLAHDLALFFLAWELMTLAAFFLILAESDREPAVHASWLFLTASHLAGLCLLALLGLWRSATGGFEMNPVANLDPRLLAALWTVALVAFGGKADLVPLHYWLPSGYGASPPPVTALLSGLLVQAGLYGFVRFMHLLPAPPAWIPPLVVGLGAVTALYGAIFATAQHELRRLLGYLTVETMGITFIGLGLATAGRVMNEPRWTVLGLGGALLVALGHSLYKPLLLLVSGNVHQSTATTDLNLLGGLGRTMPVSSLLFAAGSAAAGAMPGLPGFAGKWLIYLGLFETLGLREAAPAWPLIGVATPVLVFTGAAAAVALVKSFALAFLGAGRTAHAHDARESRPGLLAPLVLVTALMFLLGLAPPLAARFAAPVVTFVSPETSLGPNLLAAAPWGSLTLAVAGLALALALAWVWLARRLAAGPTTITETWGCGFIRPTARMQYSAGSAGEIVLRLFAWLLRPVEESPRIDRLFPGSARHALVAPDTLLARFVLPAARSLAWTFTQLRVVQQGLLQVYLLYILLILVVLLAWR